MTTLKDLRVTIPLPGAEPISGYRKAQIADLVSALRAEGMLVVESSVRHNWPAWAIDVLRYDVAALAERGAVAILDALAEAQPFPPEGG